MLLPRRYRASTSPGIRLVNSSDVASSRELCGDFVAFERPVRPTLSQAAVEVCARARQKWHGAVVGLCLLLALLCASASAYAQSVTFGGVQTTVGSGLNIPTGVAVDGTGDLFIADYSNNRVELRRSK